MNKSLLSVLFIVLMIQSGCEKNTITKEPHWYSQDSGTQNYLYQVVFPSSDVGYILTNNNSVLKTTNAGKTWTELPVKLSTDLAYIFFPDDNVGYAINRYSTILKTTDGGHTWSFVYMANKPHLNALFFVNSEVGYATGGDIFEDKGALLKTSDGGLIWEDMSDKITSKWLYSVYFTDENNGYLAGDDAILKTTNGGTSWTSLDVENNKILTSIFFTSPDAGYISGGNKIGDKGIIIKTIDGGKTWTTVHDGTRSVSSLCFPSARIGYAISRDRSSKGLILKTVDKGQNWSVLNVDIINSTLGSLWFTDINKGYVVGGNGAIIIWGKE